jgi:Domain of unknown function (DUF1857)
MVKVYAARTVPVNPPNESFVLERDLLWEALQRKIRRAPDFVPSMKECKVISDENDVVVRDCVLELGNKELRRMREEVTSVGKQSVRRSMKSGEVCW